jgi:hypothetical protein
MVTHEADCILVNLLPGIISLSTVPVGLILVLVGLTIRGFHQNIIAIEA